MSTGEATAEELLAVVKKSIRADAEFAVTPKPDGVSLKNWSIFDPTALPDETKLDTIAACAAIPVLNRGMGSIVGMAIGDAVGHPLEFLDVVDEPDPNHRYDPHSLNYTGPFNKFSLKLSIKVKIQF